MPRKLQRKRIKQALFTAIPVGQGDSFFLKQEDGFTILVDGGRSISGFPYLFQSTTKRNRVDVAICTHNDADHAHGILGFLRSGLACNELWLPGRWLSMLPNLTKPVLDIAIELTNNLRDIRSDLNLSECDDQPIFEKYAHQIRDNIVQYENKIIDPVHNSLVNGWPTSCLEQLQEVEPFDGLKWHLGFLLRTFLSLPPDPLLFSAIEAANRIREIATEAFHRGIPVRWFEFGSKSGTQLGGLPNLVPLNSCEVKELRSRSGRLLDLLALSVSNKESLVFWTPYHGSTPGVLFTADSDLSTSNLPSDTELQNALITVPHHGSDANNNAYSVIRTQATSSFTSIRWIRSDGRFRSRPGSNYLRLSRQQRFCTICRPSSNLMAAKQSVTLISRKGTWSPSGQSKTCSCQ